jgi:hypothetical protein
MVGDARKANTRTWLAGDEKKGQTHRVWLPKPVQTLLAELDRDGKGFVLAGPVGEAVERLDAVMRAICTNLGIDDKVTPHDLRRTHGTRITALGFGRDAMNRIQNHKEGGIASVYDRHRYSAENQKIMEAVATDITALAEAVPTDDNVTRLSGSAALRLMFKRERPRAGLADSSSVRCAPTDEPQPDADGEKQT